MEKKESNTLASLGVVGRADSFVKVLETVKQVAPLQITVLLFGESGTGKEIIAKAIHTLSARADRSIVTVNCGAIPEGLLESELFGHEKGSFTGASGKRQGYFEIADNGTLFLDEIGEMPVQTQVGLLRVLETQEFMRVGGTAPVKTNVRVIAATNQNLEEQVARGEFRKDLFYRLNAITIQLPPLRKRKDDIRLLAIHFARDVCSRNNIPFTGFTTSAFDLLKEYQWPGNIRELKNLIERVIILSKGEKIDAGLIEPHLQVKFDNYDRPLPMIVNKSPDQAERELIYRALVDLKLAVEDIRSSIRHLYQQPVHSIPYPLSREVQEAPFEEHIPAREPEVNSLNLGEMEKIVIARALAKFSGNRRKAAHALGIGERTLYRKIKEHNLEE